MEHESRAPETALISRLKTEWADLEKEVSSRFAALSQQLDRAGDGQVDPAEVLAVMRSEIDACLDRLNAIKLELAGLWQQP